MNSLIKYGLYFAVAFSVLAFGAAEVWEGQKSEVGSQKSEDGKEQKSEVRGQMSEGQEQGTAVYAPAVPGRSAAYAKLRRAREVRSQRWGIPQLTIKKNKKPR